LKLKALTLSRDHTKSAKSKYLEPDRVKSFERLTEFNSGWR